MPLEPKKTNARKLTRPSTVTRKLTPHKPDPTLRDKVSGAVAKITGKWKYTLLGRPSKKKTDKK